jgi:hypothetical protein
MDVAHGMHANETEFFIFDLHDVIESMPQFAEFSTLSMALLDTDRRSTRRSCRSD